MNSIVYGTAFPGVLERFIQMRTPKDGWMVRLEHMYEMTTYHILDAEQKEYASHFYDERVKCGMTPQINEVIGIILNGLPPHEYVRR